MLPINTTLIEVQLKQATLLTKHVKPTTVRKQARHKLQTGFNGFAMRNGENWYLLFGVTASSHTRAGKPFSSDQRMFFVCNCTRVSSRELLSRPAAPKLKSWWMLL